MALYDYEDDEGESGQDGKSGEIRFKESGAFLSARREDLLSPHERDRLLSLHVDSHKTRVVKRKELIEDRTAKKNSEPLPYRVSASQGRGGSGGFSKYKEHPISAKMRGRDPQVSPIPERYQGETNAKEQDNLENRNELEFQLRHRPRPSSTPRMRPPGT